jgi:hypothetical protein
LVSTARTTEFPSAHAGHHEIEQDHARDDALPEKLQRELSVRRGNDLVLPLETRDERST